MEFMAPRPYWMVNEDEAPVPGTAEGIKRELVEIAGKFAASDNGTLLLTPDERTALEARRVRLQEALHEIESRENHTPPSGQATQSKGTCSTMAELRRLNAQVDEQGRKLAALKAGAEAAGLAVNVPAGKPKAAAVQFLTPGGEVVTVNADRLSPRQYADMVPPAT